MKVNRGGLIIFINCNKSKVECQKILESLINPFYFNNISWLLVVYNIYTSQNTHTHTHSAMHIQIAHGIQYRVKTYDVI